MNLLDAVRVKRHQFTVEQYHQMGEAGVLAADARVELIQGQLVEMAPIGSRHYAAVSRLTRLLVQAIGDRAIVSPQLSIRLDRTSEPEPDLAIYKPRDDFYASALPTGADALLVIEVSDTTLDYDLRVKAPLYARHGVAEYWIFDLQARTLHLFHSPRNGAYTKITAIETPGRVALPALQDVSIDLTDVL